MSKVKFAVYDDFDRKIWYTKDEDVKKLLDCKGTPRINPKLQDTFNVLGRKLK